MNAAPDTVIAPHLDDGEHVVWCAQRDARSAWRAYLVGQARLLAATLAIAAVAIAAVIAMEPPSLAERVTGIAPERTVWDHVGRAALTGVLIVSALALLFTVAGFIGGLFSAPLGATTYAVTDRRFLAVDGRNVTSVYGAPFDILSREGHRGGSATFTLTAAAGGDDSTPLKIEHVADPDPAERALRAALLAPKAPRAAG